MLVLLLVGVAANNIAAADLDGDGDVDIASVMEDKIKVLKNLGDNCFEEMVIAAERPGEERTVLVADMNGDGWPDLVTPFVWYKNLCSGTGKCTSLVFCGPHPIAEIDDGVSEIYPGDVDGDGDLDVVAKFDLHSSKKKHITNSHKRNDHDAVVWYENRGEDGFSAQQLVSDDMRWVYGVYSADLNGDGMADALSAEYSSDEVSWYQSNGDGTWGEKKVITAGRAGPDKIGTGPNGVVAADLNGDGRMDVITSSYGKARPEHCEGVCSEIAWVENLGDGNWGVQQIISFGTKGANSVTAMDIDNDGDVDVLSTSYQDEAVSFFENLGNGTFNPIHIISTVVDHSGFVITADMDGDGDHDVVVLDDSPDSAHGVEGTSIVWFENFATSDNPQPSVDTSPFGTHKDLTCNEAALGDGAAMASACPVEVDENLEGMMATDSEAGRLALLAVPLVFWAA
jgi:hypothetical protein